MAKGALRAFYEPRPDQHPAASRRCGRAARRAAVRVRSRAFDLLYPYLWLKRRHWKRRLVSDVQRCGARARAAAGAASFALPATGADTLSWTLLRLLRSRDFSWDAERADDWRKPWAGLYRHAL